MISMSEEDRSEWNARNNPLDRELNLTEYENRVRAVNGLVDSKSNIDDLSDCGDEKIVSLKFRMASGDATDGASELSRRKSEFIQIKTEIITGPVPKSNTIVNSASTIQVTYGSEAYWIIKINLNTQYQKVHT